MRRSRTFSLFAVAALAAVAVSAPASASERELETDLLGSNEVPGPTTNDPDGRGEAEVTIDPRTGRVCFEIEVERIGPVVGGHIHDAPAGVAGPVVVNFMLTQDDFEKGEAEGCVGVDTALARDILAHPDEYYVNVHTQAFPGGAVRGQLDGDDDHDDGDGDDHDDHDDHDDDKHHD